MANSIDPRAGYISVATDMFAANGYHGASLASVAREADVTKQALLHFFGTKEALYAEVLVSLSDRLIAQIAAAHDPDPVVHLQHYFEAFLTSTRADPTDVRLVVRALLDSNPGARRWPLKSYLDQLSAIAMQTDGGRRAAENDVLAWLSQMIGMVQYVAISNAAVSGMYGEQSAAHLADRLSDRLYLDVEAFAAG